MSKAPGKDTNKQKHSNSAQMQKYQNNTRSIVILKGKKRIEHFISSPENKWLPTKIDSNSNCFFPLIVEAFTSQNRLHKGRVYSGSQFRGTSIMGEETHNDRNSGKWVALHLCQEAEVDEGWCSIAFSFLIKSRIPVHGVVTPTFRMGLPHSNNLIYSFTDKFKDLSLWIS